MILLFIFYSSLWFLIAGFTLKSIFFGFIAVGFTLFIHRLLKVNVPHIRLIPLVHFFFEFLFLSFLSGVDVARRILNPRLMVNPGFVVYNLGTDRKSVIYLLALILNLTPGTLTVKIEKGSLLIHALDVKGYREKNLKRLEYLIDRILS